MSRSARVVQIEEMIETLTPAERAEVARDLLERERERVRLAAMKALADQFEAEAGPVPEAELERVRQQWPRD